MILNTNICSSKEILRYESRLLENCDYLSKVIKMKYFQCSGKNRCNITVLPLISACEVLNFYWNFMLNSNYIGIILIEIKFSQFFFNLDRPIPRSTEIRPVISYSKHLVWSWIRELVSNFHYSLSFTTLKKHIKCKFVEKCNRRYLYANEITNIE